MVTASLILSATLMVLWGATALLWLSTDRPLVKVVVQIANTPEPTRLILNQKANHVFA